MTAVTFSFSIQASRRRVPEMFITTTGVVAVGGDFEDEGVLFGVVDLAAVATFAGPGVDEH